LLAIAVITISSVSAQVLKWQRHELSVHAGVGLSTLQYDLQTGQQKNGIGFQLGGGYAYYFLRNVALRTGLEIAFYNASAGLKNFSDSYDVKGATPEGNYTFSYEIDKYSESQQALYVNIPLMLQFQTGRTYIFYGAIGGKVGFPVNATARIKKHDLTTKGYFPHEGRTYDDLPQFGLGEYEYLKRTTDLKNFKLHYMLSAEAGLKWKVLKGNDLYTGIYVDYGLNNVQTKNDRTFVTSTLTADKLQVSPLIESRYAGTPFTESIRPLAVGLKIRFTFLQ
jgi:hypothetical protein